MLDKHVVGFRAWEEWHWGRGFLFFDSLYFWSSGTRKLSALDSNKRRPWGQFRKPSSYNLLPISCAWFSRILTSMRIAEGRTAALYRHNSSLVREMLGTFEIRKRRLDSWAQASRKFKHCHANVKEMKNAFGVEARLAPGEVAIKLDSADSRHEKRHNAPKKKKGVWVCSQRKGDCPDQISVVYTTKYFVWIFIIHLAKWSISALFSPLSILNIFMVWKLTSQN